jgi:hypothetical protein
MRDSLTPGKADTKGNQDAHSEKLKSTTFGPERRLSLDIDHVKI